MHQKKILTAALVASTVAGIGIVPAQNAEAASISSFVSNALAIANDNSHGYSMVNRWGPDYDCSSFVITCLKQAGFETGGATYSGNMVSNLTQHGFSYIPSSKIDLSSSSSLQAGDILMASGHTEIYIGNGKRVGAHRNYDGKSGDSGGNEINVLNYSRGSWYGILRYTGSGSTATAVTTAATTTSSAQAGVYKINANLNLRSGNSTGTSIMTTIPKGSSVTVSQISNGWGKTTYSGKTGWIYLSYATRTGNAATTATAQATTTPAATTTKAAATGAIYKTTANLNMRTGNSTSYSRLLTIPRGTSVTVTETKGGWGKTSYSGKTGWISLDYATKTGNVSAPAATTTATTASAPSAVAGTVYKTNGNMYLRSGNNKSSSILGVVPKGTSVTATQISNNWGKITYGGKTGWMSLKYSTKTGTVAAPAATTAKATTASSTKTASTAAATVTGKTSKTTSFIYQTTSNLNLRSGNSTSYSKLGVIPRGTGVTVTEVKNNWGKVSYGGKTGWISLDYASKKGSNVVTTINTVVKNAASSSTKTVTYSYMTTANLNLRKSFSTASAKILTMPKGTSLTVTEIKNNWGKVNYQGNVGWMSLQYAICTGSQTTVKNIIGQTSSPTLKTASVPATTSAVKTASVPATTSAVKTASVAASASAVKLTASAAPAATTNAATVAEEAKETVETKPVSFSMPVSVVNAFEDEEKTAKTEEAVEEVKEEAAVEETAVEETATEEAAVEETAVEETATEEAAVEETTAEEATEVKEEAAAAEETAVEEAEVEETEAEAVETEAEAEETETEAEEAEVEAEEAETEVEEAEVEAEEIETEAEEAEVEAEETETEAEAEVEEAEESFVAGNYAAQKEIKIYADASEGAEVLTSFAAGTVLEVSAENDGWGKVSIDGRTCWIRLADVEKTDGAVTQGLTLASETQAETEAEAENTNADEQQPVETDGASEATEDQAE